MSTPDIAAALAAAMSGEDRRRELAGQSPGLGMQLRLPQPVSGPGVGLSDVDMPVIGEGYDTVAEIGAAVQKAYGPDRPSYGAPEVGGLGYPLGIAQPAVRHVTNLGADGLFIEGASTPYAGWPLISPPAAKPGLLARLAGWLRRK